MTEQRKAIAYTRVSTNEQAISELSLEAQHREVIAQAERSGLVIVSVLTDKDESASTLNRPAMSELITHIESGRVDAVIISKLDRLTRRIKDFMSLLQRLRKAKRAGGGKGVDLISSAESLDTGSDTGQIVSTSWIQYRNGIERLSESAPAPFCKISKRRENPPKSQLWL